MTQHSNQHPATFAFDAVIFDLDGVITKTALVHSAAWKKMFDEFLADWSQRTGNPYVEFTHKADYLPYVDGKPRYKGVADFLESRGISLPMGNPSDAPDAETVCGLGNRKNQAFNEVLERDGVEVYPSTVQLMKDLRQRGIRVGVASSSKNCEVVLKAAGLMPLVETRIDGVVSAELGLKGKPEADIFTTAATRLGCSFDRSVVVEDAVSGVQAGRKGNFGLVLGVAREENHRELYENGADRVVDDLSEVNLQWLNDWFTEGVTNDQWSISYFDYDPAKERSREALLTTGNGYFGTRGAIEESAANAVNYPGTYMAGMYNRLITKIAGRDVDNEDFVNLPNWLHISFSIDQGEWFDINNTRILSISRTLDFRNGLLERRLIVEDTSGRQTKLVSQRTVSMQNLTLAALNYSITPLNYAGKIAIRSGLNGRLINEGVERYKSLSSKHLEPVKEGVENGILFLLVKTNESNHHIAQAANHSLFLNNKPLQPEYVISQQEGYIAATASVSLQAGQTIRLEKIVSVCSDKEDFIDDALTSAMDCASKPLTFQKILDESSLAWSKLWQKMDVQIEGDRMSQKLLRLHLFHLLASVSPINSKLDASITARGLHGEAYRGHIFWDELFILPLYDLHLPDVARSLLMYRYRRLARAREYAKAHGYKGAMFPWQSGSDGREETQVVHLNPLTGEWGDDHSSLQRHVSLAIAYNVWDYFWITGDKEFLKRFGAELFFEICRFWASKAVLNKQTTRYEISGVMGPDEFHEHAPGVETGGLKDNTYTNIMVAWMLGKATNIAGLCGNEVVSKTGFSTEEIDQWGDIAGKLNLVINADGILAQYDGYFDLKELDWDYYRRQYGNIYRMDRILKAEGKSPDAYKVAKQADTLMAFYNLDKAEVDEIVGKLGYQLPDDYLQRNLDYYLARTSHGSTLSRVVHARLAAIAGKPGLSLSLYNDALGSDYVDIQGGTTGEGIHAGVMAGTILIALNTFAGLNYRGEQLRLTPQLPENWQKLSFSASFKGVEYQFIITKTTVSVKASQSGILFVAGKPQSVHSGQWLSITYQ